MLPNFYYSLRISMTVFCLLDIALRYLSKIYTAFRDIAFYYHTVSMYV